MNLLTPFEGRADRSGAPRESRVIRELLPRGCWALKRRGAFVRRMVCRSRSDARFEARRSLHADNLPQLPHLARGILADLRDTGVAVRPAELPTDVLESAHRFTAILRSKQTDAPCVKTTSHELAWDPTLFLWGMSEDLLDLAECHIGLPPRYLGVEVKREMLNPAAGHSHDAVRRWHLDHEDHRILKVIVYLSRVGVASAPFTFIDLSTSAAVLNGLGRARRPALMDERVRADVPVHKQRQVIGPPMTAIYVDTGQVLHRVVPPSEFERYSVTFAYSSRKPYLTYSQLMPPVAALDALRDDLPPRQREALWGTRTP